MDRHTKRQWRKQIIRQTIDWCIKNERAFTTLTAKKFPRHIIPSFVDQKPQFTTEIEVIDMDTLGAVLHYQAADKQKYCFLNMASSAPHQFGGGYLTGAMAQEEDLCRRSNLHIAFKKMSPPVPKFGGCFVSNVSICREGEAAGYKWMPKVILSNCIMCAASRKPNIIASGDLEPKFYEEMREKIKGMLDLLLFHKQYYVILGAFGCGAYGNPPHNVAEIFRNLLRKEYKGQFAKVVFAIIDNRYTDNRKVFEEILFK